MTCKIKEKKAKYRLNKEGEFIVQNYNSSKPFANFLPGIAGKYGIPMWVFYVNRAQGIISFGIKDKDHAMLEFLSANKAWQSASLLGFRTFIKIFSGKKVIFYEPFHNGFANLNFDLDNSMFVSSYDLKIAENNLTLGLETKVEYFTIPNDSYAALARTVTIKNKTKKNMSLQLLDGLPQIVPYGTANLFLKKLHRTIEAWMNVKNLEKNVPFYKLEVDPTDRPEVIHIKEGNFYLGLHYEKNNPRIIKPLFDVQYVFGQATDFCCPHKFLAVKKFVYPKNQTPESKTPCGFLLLDIQLKPSEEKTFYTIAGCMDSQELLNSSIPRITAYDYLRQKKEENKKIIEELQSDINTASNSNEFNLYAKQTYLDNILRGGYPILLGPSQNKFSSREGSAPPSVFYLYSRKHGDLERDYNKFQLQAAYFSQGNGNYRDMNQNHRSDIWFNPEIIDENIITFFNLLQSDGFNPLVIKGVYFTLKDAENFKKILAGLSDEYGMTKIISFLNKPFTLGELILYIQRSKIKLNIPYDEFIGMLVSRSLRHQDAEHAEGFWTDHWTYNLDLLESYLSIYPEKLKELFFEKKAFTFYDNAETVSPRKEKYILKDGKPMQLHSIAPSNSKREMIKNRNEQPHTVRAKYGKGEIYQTTLINKLLCLLVNKTASLDPFGIGIEMEANKPNWFDALNGLPALFGSSVCETFELKRLIKIIKYALSETKIEKIHITEEINDFLTGLARLIQDYLYDNFGNKDYLFWDKSYRLKEDYRKNTKFGFSGNETEVASAELNSILDAALNKINEGINKAYDSKKNIYYTYFINDVKEFESLSDGFIKPTKFSQRKLPFFLESQMHALRLASDITEAKQLYKAVKASELFDNKLKMYKVTASLKSCPLEIGRCTNFSPGWLENESIWLHMEYKYLLELLKHGLFDEFYADFKNVLIPFQKPERYGRSILENVSFMVSSAFPDKNLHGNGFVARLSGSTAEFLQIWLLMNLGNNPFTLNENKELNLRFSPILPEWLFTRKENKYSFNFLSKISIVYHNPKMKDTFGKNAVKPKKIIFNDKDSSRVEINSDTLTSPYAEQVRNRQISKIDVYLE